MCALGAIYLAGQRQQADHVRDANELGAAGKYAQALRAARRVRGAPQEAEAIRVQAYALAAERRYAEASRAFAVAVTRNPNNWVLHRDWAIVLRALGRRSASSRELSRALIMNPRMAIPAGFTVGRAGSGSDGSR